MREMHAPAPFSDPHVTNARVSPRTSSPNRIILASNRGPLEYRIDKSGRLTSESGNGGVATVLTSLMPFADFIWIAAAMTGGDRRMAREGCQQVRVREHTCQQRFVALPMRTYHSYYSVFCNPVLWFLQHGLWGELRRPDLESQVCRSWERGYVPANHAFARAIVDEIRSREAPAYVMVQDYHLYMCPSYIRGMAPNVILQHFTHIPWPEPDAWEKLPRDIAESICASLLNADIVGFQTKRSAHNFGLTCRHFLEDVTLDAIEGTVARRGRSTHVRVYPVSVDVEGLHSQALSLDFARYRKQLLPLTRKHTIVRVDRIDPSKNIIGGLNAFELLLLRHPELTSETKMLAFLVPSRGSVPEFRRYAEQVWRRISEINARFAHGGWRPIETFTENNYVKALAGMSLYDVLLVNSLADGMNLVSKEGPILNERDGVLVLSQEVGSHCELGDYILSVSPSDIEGTAETLWSALTMPEEEKHRRAERLRAIIARNDLRTWLERQSRDLGELVCGSTFSKPTARAAAV